MFKRVRDKIRRLLYSKSNGGNRGRIREGVETIKDKIHLWINYGYGKNQYTPNMCAIIKKGKLVFCFFIAISVLFTYYLTIQSGIVRSANKDVDMRLDEALDESMVQNTIEGTICARNGEVITEGKEVGGVSACRYPLSFSNIVGYESKIYGSSGLRNKYKKELYTPYKKGHGSNIALTVDVGLQDYAYGLLRDNVGSIVVMKNSTGELYAMASRNAKNIELNVNKIDENFEKYIKTPGLFLNNCIQADDAPGSTFKIVTATALIDSQNEGFIYNDTGNYQGIRNFNNNILGTLDLKTALKYSSNTYFAKAGAEVIGVQGMRETLSKFKIGENIKLDCGVLKSSVEFKTNDELAMISFGQGKLTVSPLSITMIMQTIQNKGKMLKPFLIKAINDEATKAEVLSNVTGETTANKLKEMLGAVAEYYGFESGYYAKTGTAQTGASNDHIYIVASNRQYTATISYNKSKEESGVLIPVAKKLFQYIDENLK